MSASRREFLRASAAAGGLWLAGRAEAAERGKVYDRPYRGRWADLPDPRALQVPRGRGAGNNVGGPSVVIKDHRHRRNRRLGSERPIAQVELRDAGDGVLHHHPPPGPRAGRQGSVRPDGNPAGDDYLYRPVVFNRSADLQGGDRPGTVRPDGQAAGAVGRRALEPVGRGSGAAELDAEPQGVGRHPGADRGGAGGGVQELQREGGAGPEVRRRDCAGW